MIAPVLGVSCGGAASSSDDSAAATTADGTEASSESAAMTSDGSSTGASATSDSDTDAIACTPDITSIQATIFTPLCAAGVCHDADQPEASLDLASPGVAARLVGVPAAACEGDWLRVTPGDPAASLLYAKVAGPVPCGDKMPIGGELDPAALDCIAGWITDAQAECETCGGGQCVDLDSDAAHCGGCGQTCPAGVPCDAGACACPGDGALCDDACVNTSVDPAHCGGCGLACADGEFCADGACSSDCGGLTECDGGCVDVETSAQHCGGCGQACLMGQVCTAGECTCSAAVSFATDVQPILTAACATIGCHRAPAPKGTLNLSLGMAYGELVNVPSTQCADRSLVAPGDVSGSYLVDKLLGVNLCFGTAMPKGASSLSDAQIALISDWICAGAPNN